MARPALVHAQTGGRGIDVTAVDAAAASLRAAMAKPGADRVLWVHGLALDLVPLDADAATMTGNVAQAITDPDEWAATLRDIHDLLRPGGHLIVETRRPSDRGWTRWNRADSYRRREDVYLARKPR
jgi:SAM-dependent methyltransferase